MKFFIYFIVGVALISLIEARRNRTVRRNHTNHPTWKDYIARKKLKFKNENEEIKAFKNYDSNDEKIEDHNRNSKNSFILGHNDFSHWSDEEHNKHKGSISLDSLVIRRDVLPGFIFFSGQNHSFQNYGPTAGYVPPVSVDWVKSGWNTAIRNQQRCGDCWAFATTASIEAALWVKNKTNVTLSPQQLTDCSFSYGNNGCNGGVVAFAYGYVKDVGLGEDKYYPFVGNQTACDISRLSGKPLYKVSKYYRIVKGNDSALKEALAKFGPLPVAINASGSAFNLYKSGLYANTPGICSTKTDHAVLLVGYGQDAAGNKYWTIKNQWGSTWGNNGYMNISANIQNNCGISSQAFIPIL